MNLEKINKSNINYENDRKIEIKELKKRDDSIEDILRSTMQKPQSQNLRNLENQMSLTGEYNFLSNLDSKEEGKNYFNKKIAICIHYSL